MLSISGFNRPSIRLARGLCSPTSRTRSRINVDPYRRRLAIRALAVDIVKINDVAHLLLAAHNHPVVPVKRLVLADGDKQVRNEWDNEQGKENTGETA